MTREARLFRSCGDRFLELDAKSVGWKDDKIKREILRSSVYGNDTRREYDYI